MHLYSHGVRRCGTVKPVYSVYIPIYAKLPFPHSIGCTLQMTFVFFCSTFFASKQCIVGYNDFYQSDGTSVQVQAQNA
jgi:hypothetical protein